MKQQKPFAIWDADPDLLYVMADHCGIHQLIILMGEVPLTYCEDKNGKPFGKAYVKATDVIEWHKKELKQSNGASGSQQVIDAIERAMEKLRQENAAGVR